MKRTRDPLARFWIHTVVVETYLGQASDGSDTYGAPAPVTGFLEETVTRVRDRDSVEVVSSSKFYAPAAAADRFTAGTRVDAASARVAEVITVSRMDSGALGLPDHVVVALT